MSRSLEMMAAMAPTFGQEVTELKQQRRDVRLELARIRWWNRLLEARRTLEVAALAQIPEVSSMNVPVAVEALAADAPTSRELQQAVWTSSEMASATSLESLDALLVRLGHYESRLLETLDTVTAAMVKALSLQATNAPEHVDAS